MPDETQQQQHQDNVGRLDTIIAEGKTREKKIDRTAFLTGVSISVATALIMGAFGVGVWIIQHYIKDEFYTASKPQREAVEQALKATEQSASDIRVINSKLDDHDKRLNDIKDDTKEIRTMLMEQKHTSSKVSPTPAIVLRLQSIPTPASE